MKRVLLFFVISTLISPSLFSMDERYVREAIEKVTQYTKYSDDNHEISIETLVNEQHESRMSEQLDANGKNNQSMSEEEKAARESASIFIKGIFSELHAQEQQKLIEDFEKVPKKGSWEMNGGIVRALVSEANALWKYVLGE